MKKISFILAVLICAILAASCSDAGNIAESTSAQTTSPDTTVNASETVDSLDARRLVSDDLPDTDYGGEDFVVLYQDTMEQDIDIFESTGDVLDDAIYARNIAVAERFNINIKAVNGGGYEAISKTLSSVVNSGDDVYDIVMNHIIQTGSDTLKGYFYDLNEVKYIDTTKPWYPQFAVEATTLNGRCYALVTDACFSSLWNTYTTYFNKTIAANYGIEASDIYNSVDSGKWTLDYMANLTKDVYSDLNGDGKRDINDFYGNHIHAFYSLNFLWSFDIPIVSFDENGATLEINNDKTIKAIDMAYDFIYNQKGSYAETYDEVKKSFANGNSMFLFCHFLPAMNELRDMDDDYGIVPFPKYDEAQTDYKTTIDGSFDVAVIPVTVTGEKLDRAGLITEALSAESWRTVTPVFYDTVLKVKVARDEDSIRMIDIVMNGRVVDISWMYAGWSGFNFVIPDLIQNNKSGADFASYYAKNETAKLKAYQDIYDFFYAD
ncbi:MAG: extracellular solute-binding protein [Eubacteriales bacterium]